MLLARQDQREFLLLDQMIGAASSTWCVDTAHRANVALVLHNVWRLSAIRTHPVATLSTSSG